MDPGRLQGSNRFHRVQMRVLRITDNGADQLPSARVIGSRTSCFSSQRQHRLSRVAAGLARRHREELVRQIETRTAWVEHEMQGS